MSVPYSYAQSLNTNRDKASVRPFARALPNSLLKCGIVLLIASVRERERENERLFDRQSVPDCPTRSAAASTPRRISERDRPVLESLRPRPPARWGKGDWQEANHGWLPFTSFRDRQSGER